MMKSSIQMHSPAVAAPLSATFADRRTPVSTRFGELVDVRNRGALRLARLVGIQVPSITAPAVVRLWSGDKCRELSIGEARALAAQLLDAASYAESQNLD